MGFELRTRNGHNMYDMASMMQKSIRRCDIKRASYAAYELYGNYTQYMWRRLLVISAEDCYGIMTKEITALKSADDIVNKGRKGYDKDAIFVAKAVYLLCLAKKNRDACFVACEFMMPDKVLDENEIEHVDLEELERMKIEYDNIPSWVFDVHTLRGKANGKTDVEMTIEEQKALKPHQISLFDECGWQEAYEDDIRKGVLNGKALNEYNTLLKDKPRGEDIAKEFMIDEQ